MLGARFRKSFSGPGLRGTQQSITLLGPVPGRRVLGAWRRFPDARFPRLEASLCDRRGSAHLFGRGEAACPALGDEARDAARKPARCATSSLWLRSVAGWRLSPWRFPPSIARLATCAMPTRSRGICREVTLLTSSAVAPVHDAGSPAANRMGEICTLWAKIPSHACRGASRRSLPTVPFPDQRTRHAYAFCSLLSSLTCGAGLLRLRLAMTTACRRHAEHVSASTYHPPPRL